MRVSMKQLLAINVKFSAALPYHGYKLMCALARTSYVALGQVSH